MGRCSMIRNCSFLMNPSAALILSIPPCSKRCWWRPISGENDHFSSHRMDQVEEICEDIALIDHGRLVLHGNLRQIKRSMGRQILRISLKEIRDFGLSFPAWNFFPPR